MAYPSPKVYIAFNGLPYDVSPTFVDVTSYVRAINTHRGRTDDFTQFDIGTATVVLDNRTRLFDPFYTSGTYFGKLTPRLQIKITATSAAVEYDVFRGFVSGWPVTWSEAGKDSTVTLQCFDALGLMANEKVPNDWLAYTTQALSPRHYVKCNDARETNTLVDIPAAGVPNLTISAPSTGRFIADPCSQGVVGNSNYLTVTSSSSSFDTADSPKNLTISAYMDFIAVSGFICGLTYFLQGSQVTLDYTFGSSFFRIRLFNGTNQVIKNYSMPLTGTPIYYTVTLTANTGGTPSGDLYANGQKLTATSTTTIAGTPTLKKESLSLDPGRWQEISIFDRLLTDAEILNLYKFASGQISETSSARLTRIVGTTSFSSSLCSFTASPVATVSEIGSGTGVVPEMQLVADSEGGNLYVSKSGVLTLTARRAVFTDTRSANVQATIQDTGSALKYGTEVEISYDADNLKNDVTINFSGNGQVSETNTTTIAAFGASSTLIETQLDSATSADDLAIYELGTQGALVPRIQPIDLSPNTANSDWTTILGLELLDRVTFIRTPSVGNSFSRAALINAIDHTFIPGQTQTQISLSMRYTSPLILDDPVRGKYDFNYYG
jgi:hypothetical protein